MSQLPGAQARLHDDMSVDTEAPRDEDTLGGTVPSAGESTGIPPAVRQRLDAQVQSAGGNVEQIVQDLRTRIAEIDRSPVEQDGTLPSTLQAERALYVSQISYLEDHVAGYRVGSSSDMAREVGSTHDAGAASDRPMPASGRRRVRVYDTKA